MKSRTLVYVAREVLFVHELLISLVVTKWGLKYVEQVFLISKFQVDLSSVIELHFLDLEHDELRLLYLYLFHRLFILWLYLFFIK